MRTLFLFIIALSPLLIFLLAIIMRLMTPEESRTNSPQETPMETLNSSNSLEGRLIVGDKPPTKTRLRAAGGVPICPICGMPMERVEALKTETPADWFIWRESENKDWRCYHEYEVLFKPTNGPGPG